MKNQKKELLQKEILKISDAQICLAVNLAFAAISGSGATVCVQPMDLVKNRMQTSSGLSV